jgi:GNAT superfamily N-acetyltransferase
MHTALQEARQRGARWVILNVRPHNTGAIDLYRELGFEPVDTEMSFVSKRPAPPLAPALELRPLHGPERRAAYELARDAMSERLKMFRRLRTSDFALHLEDRLAERVVDLFAGQATERWGYFENDLLRATVFVRAQRLGSPHIVEIQVAPARRGPLESPLLAFALRRLAQFPRRDISVRLWTSHAEMIAALEQAGFIPGRGLMLMAKEMK